MTRYARLKKDTYFFDPEDMKFTADILVPKGTVVKVDAWTFHINTSVESKFHFKVVGHRLELNGLYSTVTFEKADEHLEFLDD